MSNFQFQTIKSREIKGYTQATSDDGSIMITRTKRYYFIYYFDGKQIIEIPFSVGQYVEEVPTNYEQQSAKYLAIKTRMVEDKIVVYILSEDCQSISRFQCEKIEGAACTGIVQDTAQLVQSMQLHPLQDSLIVTFSDSFQIIFAVDGINHPGVDLIFGDEVIESSFVYPIVTDSQCFLYFFYLKTQNEISKIRMIKVQQSTYLKQYDIIFSVEKEGEQKSSSIYLDRVEFDEKQRIFGLSLTYGFTQAGKWDGMTFFVDEAGQNQLQSTDLGLYAWDGFISGQSKIRTTLKAKYDYKVCTMQYQASSGLITFLDSTEKCTDGSYEYYDRIAVWQMNHTKHIVSQHQQMIIVWDDELNLVQELRGYTFSTNMDDVLIVNTFDELHYMQYKEVESEEPVVPEECETEVGMIVGLICLSVLIVVLIGLLVHTCARTAKRRKSKPNSSQENILTKRDPGAFDPQIVNPYAQESSLPMETNSLTKKHP